MSPNVKIIGFAGVTNGGKTSTCNRLKKSLVRLGLDVSHFSMDDYYWKESSTNHVLLEEFNYQYANWDDVCAVDWDRLEADILSWKKAANGKAESDHKMILLVEGIMIYNNEKLVDVFDKKYFFTLPKDECWTRRQQRCYLPPEPVGYFDKIAWPYYLKLKEHLHSQDDITYIDGTRNPDNIFSEMQEEIKQIINYD